MTITKAIERADELRPNPFSEEQKIRWLSELDGKIAVEIFKNEEFKDYDYTQDTEKELLAKEPYCDIYLFYLVAMIDFFGRDYGDYNNSIAMFNENYSSYVKAYKRGEIKSPFDNPEEKGNQYYKNIF